MIQAILQMLLGGSGVANVVTNGVKWTAIFAALPLAYQWYEGHAGDNVVCLNVGQTLLFAAILFVVVQTAHGARQKVDS